MPAVVCVCIRPVLFTSTCVHLMYDVIPICVSAWLTREVCRYASAVTNAASVCVCLCVPPQRHTSFAITLPPCLPPPPRVTPPHHPRPSCCANQRSASRGRHSPGGTHTHTRQNTHAKHALHAHSHKLMKNIERDTHTHTPTHKHSHTLIQTLQRRDTQNAVPGRPASWRQKSPLAPAR